MATVTSIGDQYHPDHGGGLLAFQVDWAPASPPTVGTQLRVRLYRLTAPGVYSFVKYAFSGVPGQNTNFGAEYGHVMYLESSDEKSPFYLRVVRSYTPKLPAGVYYAVLQFYDGAWATLGSPLAFRVLPRARYAEIYELRQKFPSPPFAPGAKVMASEAFVEG